MSELWMAVNVVWELVIEHAWWALAYAFALVVFLALALAGGGNWRRGWRPAWIAAVLAAAAAFALLPGLTGAGWRDLAYFVDWLLLAALSAAAGAAALVLLWPLGSWWQRRARAGSSAPRGG